MREWDHQAKVVPAVHGPELGCCVSTEHLCLDQSSESISDVETHATKLAEPGER